MSTRDIAEVITAGGFTVDRRQVLLDKPIKALEIGSWEGLSSHFILSTLSKAHLTCVDTWEGADEHKDGTAASQDTLNQIESKFNQNLKPFKHRLIKYKGTSSSFFEANPLFSPFLVSRYTRDRYVSQI